MKIRDIVRVLDELAPPSMAMEGDNVGLLVGDAGAPLKRAVLCIDLTAAVLDEATAAKAQVIVAYHPVIYKPLMRLTAEATPIAYEAARRGFAVYSPHTALDAAPGGTNDALAALMGATDCRPLEPLIRRDQRKIVVFAPAEDLARVGQAAFAAGAGRIGNYYDCAFFGHGVGTFCGGEGTRPTVGRVGSHQAGEETRLEVIAPASRVEAVCRAIREAHSYETPAIDVYPLEESPAGAGMGRVGELPRPTPEAALIARVKKAAGVRRVLLTRGGGSGGREDLRSRKGLVDRKRLGNPTRLVKTVACCAGSCGSLYRRAIAAGATFYLTGEMRHHDQVASAAAGMSVVCIGHAESERPVLAVLAGRLRQELPALWLRPVGGARGIVEIL